MAATLRQSPIASTVTATDVPNPRKRGRTACTRCKNRKQKCDDQWPICSNCRKAGTACDKIAVTEDEPPAAYTRALEERVAFLETRLNELNSRPSVEEHQPQPKRGDSTPPSNVLGEVVELLSVGNFEAPAYIGSSSGLGLALNLGEMVQATVWNKALPTRKDSPPAGRRGSSVSPGGGKSGSSSHAITMQELLANSAGPPSDELGRSILSAYFTQIHPRYPFVDPDEVWRLHEERVALTSAPVANLTQPQRFGIFRLFMIYAIGAMLLQLTEKRITSPPESYYMTALQHIFAARESRTIQNIEAMTLLVIYHLRSPSSFSIWYMIGLAMRTSIDLGFHRKQFEAGHDAYTIQMRRRLFWSVYALERAIAQSMGRPFSIPDSVIDVDFPDVGPDTETSPSSPSRIPVKKNALTYAVLLFKMRRIESRIQHSIYRVDKPLSSLMSKVDRFYQDLDAWKAEVAETLSGSDLHYPFFHYHRAVRQLLQPFLALLAPTDPYYSICMRAAGDVCQAHKRLHQTLDYGHSFIAVQTVFVSGITLLYGLWTQLHAVWSVSLANDIRACSLVLFVMGERAPWVRKYRDAFELLVNATMEKLQSGDGRLAETAAAQVDANKTQGKAWAPSEDSPKTSPGGDQQEAWRVVAEVANWIDQEEGSPVWMPDFETLQNLG
ncbi:fungal-specific transcription factor domain-containing protein [Xylariales sp. PMI_506]|nr:fungal-specific transcription factor domain-containing protein [Xylariales sp. PMI_506]